MNEQHLPQPPQLADVNVAQASEVAAQSRYVSVLRRVHPHHVTDVNLANAEAELHKRVRLYQPNVAPAWFSAAMDLIHARFDGLDERFGGLDARLTAMSSNSLTRTENASRDTNASLEPVMREVGPNFELYAETFAQGQQIPLRRRAVLRFLGRF